jgi:multiple sugar transport system permease protein
VLALAGRVIPVLTGEAYYWYATNRNPNVASAYAALVMAFTVIVTIVYFRLLKTSEAEAGYD